jgi:hypothetical protein
MNIQIIKEALITSLRYVSIEGGSTEAYKNLLAIKEIDPELDWINEALIKAKEKSELEIAYYKNNN